jgi:hypothetical protein
MLLLSAGLSLAGIAVVLFAVVVGVAIGGIPYPDGPNAGFTSQPGIGRWIETSGVLDWSFGIGALFVIVGGIACAACGGAWVIRRLRTRPTRVQ